MNIKEFYQLLSKNKITIDDNHHAFNLTRFIDNIKYQIEYYEELCKKHKNDKYFEQYYNILTVGLGVSCSADRNIKCKINKDGIWIEKLDSHPGELIPEELRQAGEGNAVKINLNQPMSEILKELDKYPVAGHASRCSRNRRRQD